MWVEIRERKSVCARFSTINNSKLFPFVELFRWYASCVCVCCCFELNAIFQTKCISDAYSKCFVIPTIWLLFYCYHKFEQLKCLWNGIHAQISQNGFDWSAERCARQKEERQLERAKRDTFDKRNLKCFVCRTAHTQDATTQLFQTTFNVDLIWQLQNNVHTHNNCIEKFDYIYFLFFCSPCLQSFRKKIKKIRRTEKKTRALTQNMRKDEKNLTMRFYRKRLKISTYWNETIGKVNCMQVFRFCHWTKFERIPVNLNEFPKQHMDEFNATRNLLQSEVWRIWVHENFKSLRAGTHSLEGVITSII